jgi:hypothetical protein
MTAEQLAALGFVADESGILSAPADCQVTVTPTGGFLEIRFCRSDGRGARLVAHRSALRPFAPSPLVAPDSANASAAGLSPP